MWYISWSDGRISKSAQRCTSRGNKSDCGGAGAVYKDWMEMTMTREEAPSHQLAVGVSMDAGIQVGAAQSPGNHGKDGAEFVEPCEDDADEFAVRFSAAQVRAKIAQAKYETKLEADAELLAAKKELVDRRYEVAERERERDAAATQCAELQTRMDALLQEHKKTLSGMRADLHLEKLLASLDVEKATRKKLQEAFERQQQTLTLAQERVRKLELQVANYQKTETVLAQSVSHLQHRFASKNQQRAATVEHTQRELVGQHEQEVRTLRDELAIARGTEKMAQGQLQELQKELKTLQDNAKASQRTKATS